jgi:hypothetical protein
VVNLRVLLILRTIVSTDTANVAGVGVGVLVIVIVGVIVIVIVDVIVAIVTDVVVGLITSAVADTSG